MPNTPIGANAQSLVSGSAIFDALRNQMQRLPRNEQRAPAPRPMNPQTNMPTVPNPTMTDAFTSNMVGGPTASDGQMTTTSTPGTGAPGVPGMGGGNWLGGFLNNHPNMQNIFDHIRNQMNQRHQWRNDWRQARDAWRADRPTLDEGETEEQFRQQMVDWRGLRPDRRDYRFGQVPATPASTVPAQGIAVGEPNPATPAPAPAPAPDPTLDPNYLNNFYMTHGYYPGQGG